MSVIGLHRLSFVSDALHDAFHRRLRELAGAGLIILAAALGLALATWSVQDPSLSHATNAPVRNMLGLGGAIVADLLTQLLGLAALALVLPVAIWGWRLASHRRLFRMTFPSSRTTGARVAAAHPAVCRPPGRGSTDVTACIGSTTHAA